MPVSWTNQQELLPQKYPQHVSLPKIQDSITQTSGTASAPKIECWEVLSSPSQALCILTGNFRPYFSWRCKTTLVDHVEAEQAKTDEKRTRPKLVVLFLAAKCTTSSFSSKILPKNRHLDCFFCRVLAQSGLRHFLGPPVPKAGSQVSSHTHTNPAPNQTLLHQIPHESKGAYQSMAHA